MHQDIATRTALVLETNNLRGGADAGRVGASLQRCVARLATQSVALATLAQVVVTHDGLDADCCEQVQRLAGRGVDFVRIDPAVGYYEAKNAGFAATDARRCEFVVFADSDCEPEPAWLAELLAPFADADAPAAVAGRTSYADTVVGTALTTIDFMYFPSPLAPGATRNFYANNVVFRRAVFAQHGYQALAGIYRAHCQVLGLRLQEAGVALRYAPRAHTVHRLPDTWRETLQLRWMRGRDTQGLVPHLARAYLPARLRWLAQAGPLSAAGVQLSRLWFSLRALNRQDLPPLRGLRRAGGLALIFAFSAIDFCGALLGGWRSRPAGADVQALSYHRH